MSERNDFDAVVSDAAYYMAPPLTARLQKMATDSGWPLQVANSLTMTFDGNELFVDQPPALKEMVDDLEYGKGSTAPNSVIRALKNRCDDIVRDVYLERSVIKLFEIEEVFGG